MSYLYSSAGKESACKSGDPGLIPGSGRSPGEGMGYPLQCSWASLVAQLVRNLPAMLEIWVQSLGWEDPLEKRTSGLENSMDCLVHGVTKNQTQLSDFHTPNKGLIPKIYTQLSTAQYLKNKQPNFKMVRRPK